MTDNRTTELLDDLRHVGNLHEFAELFGFNWHDDSDWTWHDVAVKMADDFEQAIAATLGSEPDETELIQTYDAGFQNGVMAVFQQLEGIESYEELQDFIAEYWGEGEGYDEP